MDELKPCPFCGNDYIKVDSMRFGMQAWCPECLAHGPTTQVAPGGTAQSAWNDLRAAEDDLRARAEAAEQRAEAAEAALAAARVAWHDAVENFHTIDRHGEATEICEWACALRDALADAEPDWGAAGGAR
jgi:hypothetical protein